MNRKIKLIWDFRGDDAQRTAEHHKIHLSEFADKENLELKISGIEKINEIHWTAYMLAEEKNVFAIRDLLLPHRAEIVD